MYRSAWLLIILLCSALGAAADAQQATLPQIVAAAEGEARVTPDRVYADVTVETIAPTAVAAASENARLVTAVRAALEQAGARPADMSDVGFSVQVKERYEQGTTRQEGYQAVHTLRVETAALDRIGALIDAALAGGATRIQSVRYTAANLQPVRRAALAAAVERARTDAESMAQAAGGQLGSLLELTTSRFGTPPGVLLQEQQVFARVAEETSITPRELVVRATVIGRWGLVPQ
jgi:uncharacterized protein